MMMSDDIEQSTAAELNTSPLNDDSGTVFIVLGPAHWGVEQYLLQCSERQSPISKKVQSSGTKKQKNSAHVNAREVDLFQFEERYERLDFYDHPDLHLRVPLHLISAAWNNAAPDAMITELKKRKVLQQPIWHRIKSPRYREQLALVMYFKAQQEREEEFLRAAQSINDSGTGYQQDQAMKKLIEKDRPNHLQAEQEFKVKMQQIINNPLLFGYFWKAFQNLRRKHGIEELLEPLDGYAAHSVSGRTSSSSLEIMDAMSNSTSSTGLKNTISVEDLYSARSEEDIMQLTSKVSSRQQGQIHNSLVSKFGSFRIDESSRSAQRNGLIRKSSSGSFTTASRTRLQLKSNGVDLLLSEVLVKAHEKYLQETVKKAVKYRTGRALIYSDSALHPDGGFHYQGVLSFASKYSRPVRFIRWGQELSAVNLTTLCERSILSLLQTGRYIDVHHLERMLNYTTKKLSSCHDLARSAGFLIDEKQMVTPLITPKSDYFGKKFGMRLSLGTSDSQKISQANEFLTGENEDNKCDKEKLLATVAHLRRSYQQRHLREQKQRIKDSTSSKSMKATEKSVNRMIESNVESKDAGVADDEQFMGRKDHQHAPFSSQRSSTHSSFLFFWRGYSRDSRHQQSSASARTSHRSGSANNAQRPRWFRIFHWGSNEKRKNKRDANHVDVKSPNRSVQSDDDVLIVGRQQINLSAKAGSSILKTGSLIEGNDIGTSTRHPSLPHSPSKRVSFSEKNQEKRIQTISWEEVQSPEPSALPVKLMSAGGSLDEVELDHQLLANDVSKSRVEKCKIDCSNGDDDKKSNSLTNGSVLPTDQMNESAFSSSISGAKQSPSTKSDAIIQKKREEEGVNTDKHLTDEDFTFDASVDGIAVTSIGSKLNTRSIKNQLNSLKLATAVETNSTAASTKKKKKNKTAATEGKKASAGAAMVTTPPVLKRSSSVKRAASMHNANGKDASKLLARKRRSAAKSRDAEAVKAAAEKRAQEAYEKAMMDEIEREKELSRQKKAKLRMQHQLLMGEELRVESDVSVDSESEADAPPAQQPESPGLESHNSSRSSISVQYAAAYSADENEKTEFTDDHQNLLRTLSMNAQASKAVVSRKLSASMKDRINVFVHTTSSNSLHPSSKSAENDEALRNARRTSSSELIARFESSRVSAVTRDKNSKDVANESFTHHDASISNSQNCSVVSEDENHARIIASTMDCSTDTAYVAKPAKEGKAAIGNAKGSSPLVLYTSPVQDSDQTRDTIELSLCVSTSPDENDRRNSGGPLTPAMVPVSECSFTDSVVVASDKDRASSSAHQMDKGWKSSGEDRFNDKTHSFSSSSLVSENSMVL